MADTQRYPTFSGIGRFNTFADFPTDASDGTFAVDLLTNNLYEWDETTLTWLLVSNPTAGVITGGGAPNQITYWATASNLAGDDDLTWDNSTKTFTCDSLSFSAGDVGGVGPNSLLFFSGQSFLGQAAQTCGLSMVGEDQQKVLLGDLTGVGVYIQINNFAGNQFHLYDNSVAWIEYSSQRTAIGDVNDTNNGLKFIADSGNGWAFIGGAGAVSEGNQFLFGDLTSSTLSLGVPGKDNYLRIGGTDAEDLTFFSSGDSADHFQILGSIKYYAIGFDGLPNNSVLQIDSTNNTINLICDSTGANQQIMQMSSFDNYTSIGGTSNIFLDSGFEGIFLATNNVTRIAVQNTFTSLEAYGTSPGETYELRFKQLISVSGYYIGFKAPDSRTSSTNLILKLPPNDPTAGQVIAFTAPVSGVSTGSWSTPLSSGTAWLLDGNTNGSEKYIGTDDNFRFPIRVNNVETISFETNSSINRDGVLYSVAGTSGTNTNTTWGRLAGNAISSGTHNLLFGSNAGLLISSSSYNVIVGVNAGVSMTTSGGSNVFIGEESGHDQTTGYENVFIGQGSGRANLSGQRSVAIGTSAANLGTACDRFVAIGYSALGAAGSAADCVGIGYSAGIVNTGNSNTYVGSYSGYTMTSCNSNVMLGYSATLSTITQSNAFVVGSSYAPIYDVYVGQGDFNASASAVTYHGTGGVGTDKVGGDLVMAAGQGTGAGTIGTFIIKTPTLASTGTTIQSLATRATFAQTNVSFSPHGTSSGNTYELRFLELAANGSNYTGFKAADSLAQTTTYIWPSTDPTAGQYLSSSAPSSGVCTLSWGTPNSGVAKAAYTDTIAWTGTTAPSGATNHEFWWKQSGSLITVTISLSYATAGSALSLVDMILPAAIPVPVAISGTTTNDKVASGIGWIDSASNGTPPACRVWMIKNASTYSIRIAVASNNSKVAFATITYSTN